MFSHRDGVGFVRVSSYGRKATSNMASRNQRRPQWLKTRLPAGPRFFAVRGLVHSLGLNTVCESASCPNIGDCWSRKALTVMILGNVCTRSCRFCDVQAGRPAPPDPDEPQRVATMLAELGLEYAVITCVTRDDLPDGGAAHWASTIREIKARSPALIVEALTSDFGGSHLSIDTVLEAAPAVFAHNLETVSRLAPLVRSGASYQRSCNVLEHAKRRGAITKTGLMLGLGETQGEVRQTLADARSAGVDIVTLGQYLRPSAHHLEVDRYVPPEEFSLLSEDAKGMGFAHVEAGPLVRSSFHADAQVAVIRRSPGWQSRNHRTGA
ncbi:MAG: lipoyl synthase [Pseudomonadota bacterium]